jgi:hypothetical protein
MIWCVIVLILLLEWSHCSRRELEKNLAARDAEIAVLREVLEGKGGAE